MPVAANIRCEFVDPTTNSRCRKAGMNILSDQRFCDAHAPQVEDEETTVENFETATITLEILPPSGTNDAPAAIANCACGCGFSTAKGREFKQGHDQRHKGNLLRTFDADGDAADAARDQLIQRGWKTWGDLTERQSNTRARVEARALREMAKAAKEADAS